MKKYIFSALCAIAITSCSTQKTAMDITGTWNIEKAMGKGTVGAETAPFIQFENDGKMYGNASVNRFFGNYQLKGNKLKFSNLGMTLMLGASMDIEDAVKQAIDRSNTIKADDFKAYIFGEKNDTVMVLKKQK